MKRSIVAVLLCALAVPPHGRRTSICAAIRSRQKAAEIASVSGSADAAAAAADAPPAPRRVPARAARRESAYFGHARRRRGLRHIFNIKETAARWITISKRARSRWCGRRPTDPGRTKAKSAGSSAGSERQDPRRRRASSTREGNTSARRRSSTAAGGGRGDSDLAPRSLDHQRLQRPARSSARRRRLPHRSAAALRRPRYGSSRPQTPRRHEAVVDRPGSARRPARRCP